MNKSETVQENMTYKFLWDYEIQIDQLILVFRPELVFN